ncbi:MAG: zinc-ribbon domain-containing protein [Desulfobacterales bacterium]|nr:zinc-ribbon domain-containing protein [Desulfobacterales bacterium]
MTQGTENMIATCPKCRARLKVPLEKVRTGDVRIRCPRCDSVLRVKRPVTGPAKAAGKTPRPGGSDQQPAGRQPGGSSPRRFQRFPFKKKIMIDNAIMINGIDISEGGLFVYTGRSFIVGSKVGVALPLPGGDLEVHATVQHNEPGVGMGLQFVDLSPEQLARLRKYFAELSANDAAAMEKRKTVLLAGGSEMARRITKGNLMLEGYAVFEAMDTKEVMRKISSQIPDIIVIDWQEKALDGADLLARLQRSPKWRRIAKVVVSAVTDKALQQRVMAAGADRFLAKMDTPPVKLAERIKEIAAARDSGG